MAEGRRRDPSRRRHDMDDRHVRSRIESLYWGTGNPNPVLAGEGRRATIFGPARLWRSIRIRASWRGISSRLRTILMTGMRCKRRSCSTGNFNGQPRKLMAQASRNGYFFVLDRATGKNLLNVSVYRNELGERNRSRSAARFRVSRKSPRRTAIGRAGIRRIDELDVSQFRSILGCSM